nr:reverse transcriptase domain-containing protein [Tanacetum cinerariifolium]
MADDRPMWGNNRAIAPTPRAAIVAVDLRDNFIVKGHHLSMIKDRQFDGRALADPHKHIAEFVKICRMFRYGNNNVDAIKLKLFASSLFEDAKVWFNELSPDVITTWEEMRQAFDHTHRQSVMTNPWEYPKKKPTMAMKDIEEADIKETTMVEVLDIGVTSGNTYDPPGNPNAKTTIIHDDSEDEVDEAEKEVEPSSSKQIKSNPPPLKAYKPKIPYHQRLRKEKMKEQYAKFIDLIKEVKINVSLVDVLAVMPNYRSS